MFEIQGDVATFYSDSSHPNNTSWTMTISGIAIIALEHDDIPDYGYTETFIFINKQRNIAKVDIDKIKDPAQFDPFWKTLTDRLGIVLDYRREFRADRVKVVYPNELYGKSLFQPWTITSWLAILLHYFSHIWHSEKRKLNQVVIDYLDREQSKTAANTP